MKTLDLSRRDFLAAAAAGAALAITPTAASADEPTPGHAGDTLLRWGLIGTGTRGTWTHIPVLKEAPDSKIVALCDTSEQRLSFAADKAGTKPELYSDYQKLLASPDVNAVVIATPNLLHREMLQAAIQAGKHVLCEKPAGASPADAATMKRAVESAKTVVMFGMQYRNQPLNRKVYELMASGRIGRPRYLVQNCSRGDWNTSPNVWQYADPKLGGKPMNWRFSHAASGGTLNEFDCHYFDLLHWMTGALPQSVSCDGGISVYHDGRDTWDHAAVTLNYPDNVTAVHTLCLFGPNSGSLQIMGEEGSIVTTPAGLRVTNPARRGSKKGGAKVQEIQPDMPTAHSADAATLALYLDFLQCLKIGKKPDADIHRAVVASRTCWLAELAAERKAQVKWEELG